jgi:hypothetical protein
MFVLVGPCWRRKGAGEPCESPCLGDAGGECEADKGGMQWLSKILGRRGGPRDRSLVGFAMRLAAGLGLAFMASGAIGFWFISHELVHDRLRSEAAIHRADARSLHLRDTVRSDKEWRLEVQERLSIMQQRPGTLEALLIDDRYRIAAAGDESVIGLPDRTARVEDALV